MHLKVNTNVTFQDSNEKIATTKKGFQKLADLQVCRSAIFATFV